MALRSLLGQGKSCLNTTSATEVIPTGVASFVESKKNPGVFGLKNESQLVWKVEYPGREAMHYEPGKVVTMIPETRIHIGSKVVEIKK